MKSFLVQVGTAPDGSLPPDNWDTIEATDKQDAAIKAARNTPNIGALLPVTVYVSIGNDRQPNGAPFMVQAYELTRAN